MVAALLFCLSWNPLSAREITANSGNRTDVGNAVTAAVNGDTVIIPAGTWFWSNTLVIAKSITLQGAGIGQTRLVDHIKVGGQMIVWTTVKGKAYRLTGVEFTRGATGRGFDQGVVSWNGSSVHCRMDHCKFDRLDNENVYVQGPFGVTDHCEVELLGAKRFIMFNHHSVFGGSYGDRSWETNADWGGPNAWYVEDCKIWRTLSSADGLYGCVDGWMGGRLVMRNSSITNCPIGNHGTESGQRLRGARSIEFYRNTFALSFNGTGDSCINMRGGGLLVFSNKFLGNYNSAFKLTSYRQTGTFAPWGSADGTKAWDTADLSDGPNTPGGAGDGVFEAGVSTSTGASLLTDSTKTWTANQWRGYVLRVTTNFVATGGGSRSAVVGGANWNVNQWAGYEFTKTSDNSKGYVSGNSANTLTLSSSYYAVNMSGGGAFTLSKSALISGNTATSVTVNKSIEYVDYYFPAVTAYEMRRLDKVLDDPGMGATAPIVGSPANPQNLNQQLDPIYEWGNILPHTYYGIFSTYPSVKAGRNFFANTVKPGYTPYTYPHPLTTEALGLPAVPKNLNAPNQ